MVALPHPQPSPRGRGGLLLLPLLLLICGCRDLEAEAFARAQMQHEALLLASTRPDDKKYDAVLADLAKVTEKSKHFAEAQKLKRIIEGGRVKVRTPLALGPNGRRPPLLEAQLAACARLAEIAGADGGVNVRALEALEECRKKSELLELEYAHPEEVDAGAGELTSPSP
ncbi:MAG: hypothetical protein JNM17_01500 [Archangium sp.]|nr:hypothetical protein [Archangium sp.]